MKKIAALFTMTLFSIVQLHAAQGMSMWSSAGEVTNPDQVVRRPVKKAEPKKEEPKKETTPPKQETKPTPAPVAKTPEPEPKVEPKTEELPKDEYSRSVGNLNISKDTFESDKKEIMSMISELALIMKDKNYKKWLEYIDHDSQAYWSKLANLRKAQNRMPVKGIQLKSLEDYFKYVFVPARTNRTISEIRYISETYVKAVEVQNDMDLIYYYVKKNNGKWIINIPPLD